MIVCVADFQSRKSGEMSQVSIYRANLAAVTGGWLDANMVSDLKQSFQLSSKHSMWVRAADIAYRCFFRFTGRYPLGVPVTLRLVMGGQIIKRTQTFPGVNVQEVSGGIGEGRWLFGG